MASENETIADIEQALRDGSIYDENGCFDSHEIADRLEAARKRQDEKISFVKRCLKILDVELTRWSNGEKPVMSPTALLCPVLNAREALGEDVIAVPKMETAHNAAVMREALEEARDALDTIMSTSCHNLREITASRAYRKCREALSAPPRNCDMPECATIDGMVSAHEEFCKSWHEAGNACAICPHNKKSGLVTCREVWLISPAEKGAEK